MGQKKDDNRVRAEASFKKKEQQAREGNEARAEYEAANRDRDKNAARLRALRLAKEAANRGGATQESSSEEEREHTAVRRSTG
jgi:hypothetical protein